MGAEPKQNGDSKEFEILEADMYFIYSFMCDKAVNVEDNGKLDGSKEYCEEFRKGEGFEIYKNNYEFAYDKRISRQLVLNMPYRHIPDKIEPISVTENIKTFLDIKNIKVNSSISFTDCVFKIYEDGRGIFRFKFKFKFNTHEIQDWSIKDIVRFMDVSSLPEVWREVEKKIDERIKSIKEKQGEDMKWVEIEMNDVVPSERKSKEQDFIWQTPQILLHLEMNKTDYEEFIGKNVKKSFPCNKRLQWIHYILNKSKGCLDTTDITFARYFTSILKDGGDFDVLNMCYDNEWYYTLSSDILLFVSQALSECDDKYKSTTQWVKVRLLEVYEFLRLRWYSLSVADELLDKAIHKLNEIRVEILEKIQKDKTDLNAIISEISEFLNDWINKKCIILRTFEDPSTQRCAGISFNLVYKKGEEYFLIKELEEMVRFKLEHIDKVYTDIMDLARLKLTNLAKPK